MPAGASMTVVASSTQHAALAKPLPSAERALRDALLESRGRWRDLVEMAADLAFDTDGATAFNPFQPAGPVRRRRAWLRRPDGGSVCLSFAAVPLFDANGDLVGARGVGQDTTEQDSHDASVAAALRRTELL